MARRPRRKPELTVAKAERLLRCAVLGQRTNGRRVEVKVRRLVDKSAAALITIKDPWDTGPHIVTIHLMWYGLVPSLIHELCHVVFRTRLRKMGEFEEGVVNDVMEPRLQSYICDSATRKAWWEGVVDDIMEDAD